MKIQAAIFDIGNVLLPFDYERAARGLLKGSSHVPDREAITASVHAFECGHITREEFAARVRGEFRHEGGNDEFVAVWEDIFDENPEMNRLVAELAEKIPLYLLSNTSSLHRDFIFRRYPVFRHFRRGVYSFEVGLLKPDPAIFAATRDLLGVDPARTLYIDDMPDNAAAAREAGFVTIHYSLANHREAETQIRELTGLPPQIKES